MDYLSLLLPISYLILLIGSLATFSTLYRRRQARAALTLEPWFPPHTQRNIYLSLLELQAAADTKVPDTILRAALLRRAVEDIHRLISIRNQNPALGQLLQRGSVGDDLWKRFQAAEKEMEVELKDVVAEANALAPLPSGANPQLAWGNTIFQSASEMAHREVLMRKLGAIEGRRKERKSEWEERRRGISERFMGELGGGGGVEKGREALQQQTQMQTQMQTQIPRTPVKEEKKNGSSDEDTVMVEAETEAQEEAETGSPEAANSQAGTPGAGGGKKKKKGKR